MAHGILRRMTVVVLVCLGLFCVGLGVGLAGWSTPEDIFRSASGDWCHFGRQLDRHPSANPAYELDYNGYHYQRDYNAGCSFTYTAKTFGSSNFGLSYLYLVDAHDPSIICDTIGSMSIPGNLTMWGVGRPVNRVGVCAGETHFTIMHKSLHYGAFWVYEDLSFHDFTYTP